MKTKITNKLKRLIGLDYSIENLGQEIQNLRQSTFPDISNLPDRNLVLQLTKISSNSTKAQFLKDQINILKSSFAPAEVKPFKDYEDKLQKLNPQIYPIYCELFENGKKAYQQPVDGNFASWDNFYSTFFERFVFQYLSGHVLDIGCGTRNKPIYLSGYPDSKISAVEPLELEYEPDFEVIRGFSEFLPWNSNSFSTAIASTSLDHVLDLDRSLEEIKRVLLPNGLFLVWISSIKGAKPYNPNVPNFAPEDEFHLFHFDEKWFEPLMNKHRFEIVDKMKIPQAGFDHIFYCFQSKE